MRFRGMFFANPSPVGRGCREAAGEGYGNEETLKKNLWYPSPDPLSRVTLSRRERDLPITFLNLDDDGTS